MIKLIARIEAALAYRLMKIIRRAERHEASRQITDLKIALQSCGEVRIAASVFITHPAGVAIGNNVSIGEDSFFYSDGGLQIQDNVRISRRVTIYSSDHVFRGPHQMLPFGAQRSCKQVVIERNAWIGMNVCILPGVRIGEGAIVGMGAVIAKDVPCRAIVGQPPFREIGMRNELEYETGKSKGLFAWPNGSVITPRQRTAFRQTGRQRTPEIIFVATVAWSSSAAITERLNQYPKIEARHEPRLQLGQWSTEFAHYKISPTGLAALLEELYLDTSTYSDNSQLIEVDRNSFNLIPFLAEILPKARFIWLTRAAHEDLDSLMSEGWYAEENSQAQSFAHGHHRRNRITGVDTREVSAISWDEMTAFEKNCWYWSYFNRTVSTSLVNLEPGRWRQLSLDDLTGGKEDILAFIDPSIGKNSIKSKGTNTSYNQSLPKSWSVNDLTAYERWCAPLMAKSAKKK